MSADPRDAAVEGPGPGGPSGTVVLGVGSPLMGDDGIGVRAVELLRDRWMEETDLAFIDGATWGMRVLPQIEDAQRLLLIDAIKAGGSPGALVRLDGEQIPRHLHHKLSPHQIELGEVLAVADLRGTLPETLVALGIEPVRIELRDGLSSQVSGRMPVLLSTVEEELRSWGHVLRARTPESRTAAAAAPREGAHA